MLDQSSPGVVSARSSRESGQHPGDPFEARDRQCRQWYLPDERHSRRIRAASSIGQYRQAMARTRCYINGVLTDTDFDASQLAEHLQGPGAVVWVDIFEPDADELSLIADELELHELAVEDAIHAHQRPKLDRYPDHAFLSAYAVRFDSHTAQLTTHELAAFITPRALVTVRKGNGIDIEAVMARWDSTSDLAKYGVAFLVHGLLDYVVDTHFNQSSSSMRRSRASKTCYSPPTLTRKTCSAAPSNYARAKSCCAGTSCPCSTSSTRSCAATYTSSTNP